MADVLGQVGVVVLMSSQRTLACELFGALGAGKDGHASMLFGYGMSAGKTVWRGVVD